jgi:hypothetical protein
MDPASSDIRAVEFTLSSDGDSPVLPELLNQIPEGEEIGTVTADGADDPGLGPFMAKLIHWTNWGTPFTPPLPHGDRRPTSYRNHPHPQEWATVERGLPGRDCQNRNPGCHPALWPGILEALDPIPYPKSD